MPNNIPWYLPAIVGGSLVLASIIGSYSFYAVHTLDNVLTVTGSAKKAVTADTAKWTLTITRRVSDDGIAGGYASVARDSQVTQAFLAKNGVASSSIASMPATLEEIYNQNGYLREYNVRQIITIQSKDVTLTDSLSKRMSELSASGVVVTGNYVEYYVSNLPELRVELLGAAITDAKARATEIAKAGGQSVGRLKSASSGVVQVLAPNSIEISDYGTYDTQSKDKEVMVTARATFFVQ